MAGKAVVLTSRRLAYAVDKLSKNALIELVVDLARGQIGAEMSDEQLATQIEEWVGPVLRERGDKPANLVAAMKRLDANDQAYREMSGKFTQINAPETPR